MKTSGACGEPTTIRNLLLDLPTYVREEANMDRLTSINQGDLHYLLFEVDVKFYNNLYIYTLDCGCDAIQ